MPGGHQHRAGSLKQSNKKNKRSKASKRSLSRSAGGKVAKQKSLLQRQIAQSKTDRKHRQEQIRQNKRNELMRKRRGMGGGGGPGKAPRVVGIISLGVSTDLEEQIRQFLAQDADHQVTPHAEDKNATLTVKYNVHKKDGVMTLLTGSTAFANHYHNVSSNKSETGDNDMEKNDSKEEKEIDHAVMAALDLARVADVLVFVVDGNGPQHESDPILDMQIGDDEVRSTNTSKTIGTQQNWDHLISDRGDRILTACKAQGLPTVLTVLVQTEKDPLDLAADGDHMTMQSVKSIRRSSIKRRLDLKKYVGRFATTEFGNGNDKVMEVDLSSLSSSSADHPMDQETHQESTAVMTSSTAAARTSPATLIRTLCSISCEPSKWVANSPRSYIVSDQVTYHQTSNELLIAGYIRGVAPLDINALVHIPILGTFAPKSIVRQEAPIQRRKDTKGGEINGDSTANVLTADADQQESLNMFATPDALQGEQNLIGFDNDDDNDAGTAADNDKDAIARPAGWSDYQSAWLDAMGDDGFDEDDADRGELAKSLNQKKSDATSVAPDMDLEEANNISNAERQSLLEQRRKEQSEHEEFPDEVQVDEDEKASERFARYRSLKSFRKSPWDPKENLPESYATVYHFSSFKATQRTVMNDMKEAMRAAESTNNDFFGKSPVKAENDVAMEGGSDDEEDFDPLEGCIPAGSYVTLTLGGVTPEKLTALSSKSLLTAVSLLEHENKVSVLHMGLSQSTKMVPSDAVPIKSKDILTFRCGWRTWQARPVFSQNNLNCDKHKFERFLPAGGAYFAASAFGPVTYTPCPILVFKDISGRQELVAAGTMMNSDADRIVIKRIILTGYPVRVHKRHATVKYMFYNPEDVKWFKPAELYSKHGLRGNIIESVGEHGTMKCLFNAPIKQHDTVCLPLYKRVYPKYVSATVGESEGSQEEGMIIK